MSTAASGNIGGIWRYPVKSMAGEEIPATEVTPRGLLGDRAYALVDTKTNRAAVVRTWGARMLSYSARFEEEPAGDQAMPGVRVTTPDGSVIAGADIETKLAVEFDRPLHLLSQAPEGLLVEFPKGTLGGTLAELTEAPLAGSAAPGTFFDLAPLHLITTATLEQLQAATPNTRIDARRFRPNFVVQTDTPLAENGWVGRNLAIGDQVVIKVTMACPRCVNVTAEQPGLNKDAGLLRTIGKLNTQDLGDFGVLPCIGVYAEVVQPGLVKKGDAVRVLD
jgi:uncharacterized protein YcbX